MQYAWEILHSVALTVWGHGKIIVHTQYWLYFRYVVVEAEWVVQGYATISFIHIAYRLICVLGLLHDAPFCLFTSTLPANLEAAKLPNTRSI